jgi:hypothetical protein
MTHRRIACWTEWHARPGVFSATYCNSLVEWRSAEERGQGLTGRLPGLRHVRVC